VDAAYHDIFLDTSGPLWSMVVVVSGPRRHGKPAITPQTETASTFQVGREAKVETVFAKNRQFFRVAKQKDASTDFSCSCLSVFLLS